MIIPHWLFNYYGNDIVLNTPPGFSSEPKYTVRIVISLKRAFRACLHYRNCFTFEKNFEKKFQKHYLTVSRVSAKNVNLNVLESSIKH